MSRRLTVLALALTLALVPLSASATVAPDTGYGDAGTATVSIECASGTVRGVTTKVAINNRFYVLQECAGGYHRLIALGDDGEIDTDYGYNGRLTVKFPTTCIGASTYLRPGLDGALYIVSEGQSPVLDGPGGSAMKLCMARVTATGKLATKYGGSTPIRKLNRTGGGYNRFVGAEVDKFGKLLLFTERRGTSKVSAAFINRYTTSGVLDPLWSFDGERTVLQPRYAGLVWGGVLGSQPHIAINAYDPKGGIGTQFVRFTEYGDPDIRFSNDGMRFVTSAEMGGGRTGLGRITFDYHKRIVFAVAQKGLPGASPWVDVMRLSPIGTIDTAFSTATKKLQGPIGSQIPFADLQHTAGRLAVTWELDNTLRTTGYNGTGTRWAELGTNGTAELGTPQFAPERTRFYDVDFVGDPLTSVKIARFFVG